MKTLNSGALILALSSVAGCAPILPPIMENADQKGTLLERVSALHPIGSKSKELVEELKQQGFDVSLQQRPSLKQRVETGPYYQAWKKLPGNIFPCAAMIDWRPDAEGNILAYEVVGVGCAGP